MSGPRKIGVRVAETNRQEKIEVGAVTDNRSPFPILSVQEALQLMNIVHLCSQPPRLGPMEVRTLHSDPVA